MSKSIASIARHDRIRREVLNKSDLIPSLPEVVIEVMKLLNDVDADIKDFEAPLSKDTALVARMLKLVNSPFYGAGRQVSTISEGVSILGFKSLRSMVLAASTANFLERDFSCYGHDEKGLWFHSICVAAGAKCLAERFGADPAFREEVFVAGLLHDIGKMLLGPYLVAEKIDILGVDAPEYQVEIEHLGLDHQEAGAIIGAKWRISPLVQAVLGHHHNGDGPGEYQRAIAIVRLADVTANRLGRGYIDGMVLETEPTAEDLAVLSIDTDDWPQVVEQMTELMEAACSTMGEDR